jgi:hypothetical protein
LRLKGASDILVEYKYNGTDYCYNTKDIPKIQMPLYNSHCIERFYLPAGKAIVMPVRFSFEAVKSDVFLRATLIAPSDCDELSAKMKFPKFGEVMADCIENDTTLPHNQKVKAAMQILANSLNNSMDSSDGKLLVLKKAYKYPSFILKNGEIIGIGEKTAFNENEEGNLIAVLSEMKGPYLSMDLNKSMVEIIVLDNDGDLIASLRGSLQGISGYNLAVQCEIKVAQEKSVAKCQDIFDEYGDNSIEYFMER